MKPMLVAVFAILSMLCVQGSASAQLIAAKDGPVVYGHHHLSATNIDAHKRFWIDTLGGTSIKIGSSPAEIIKIPNVFIMLAARPATGGTKGTTVDHLGFTVPNLRAAVDKAKAAGYPIITRAELPAAIPVKDDLGHIADQSTYVAFVMGPDETKVELFEVKSATVPIALHHIHFAAPNVAEMQAWYAKIFGATPGKRGSFVAGDLPGVNLSYSPAPNPVVGTRGRALDHIGFEVKNLEAFTKQLEASGIKLDRPFTKVPALNLSIAFLTDPWGTYIELTEGFNTVP